MYARFFRWASDRVDANGIIAFVSNSIFIDSRTFDGFRKVVAQEFNEIWIVDLKGNARTSGERRQREGGNIFDDQIRVGVAVYFLVRRKGTKGCRIFYDVARDYAKSDEKREFLTSTPLRERAFEEIRPDAKYNWLYLTQNDFESLLPIATKNAKSAKTQSQERAIFKLYSLGISTNRDEWVYGLDRETLSQKARYLVDKYDVQSAERDFDAKIKWSRNLKRRFSQHRKEVFESRRIVEAQYRPYCRRYLYDSDLFVDEGGSKNEMFPVGGTNVAICFSDIGSRTSYCVLAVDGIADLHFGSSIDAYQQVPLDRFGTGGETESNITDWALDQFKKQYQPGRAKPKRPITKEAIFHYVYGVLHDPVYREKYAVNLKREFPRIPFYAEFWQWADWGKALMELHIGYETVEPFALKRVESGPSPQPSPRKRGEGASERAEAPKAMLKADKEAGRIVLDSRTTLAGVPPEAWDYKLGNRSALEWILDQYKEKKPKDPTIREKFDTYRFADYKEKVIDLLMCVTRVSVETQAIVEAMREVAR